jgi:hypothetical protein
MRRAASSLRGRIVLGALAALVLGWSGSAAAEKKRVGVPRFDGPQEQIVRKAVLQVLRGGGYEVVGPREIDTAAQTAGAQLDSNDGFKAVAKELSISAFVTGEVSKKKAKLTVRNGADGSVSGEGSFGGANPNKIAADVRDVFARRLGSAVARVRAPTGAKAPVAAAAPEAEEPADNAGAEEAPAKTKASAAETTKTDEAPASSGDAAPADAPKAAPAAEDDTGAIRGPRALDISIGFGGVSRNLSYNQDLYGLRAYKLALGPVAALHVVLYPASFFTSSFVANLGLELNLDQTFSVTSSVPPTLDATGAPAAPYPNGATFDTVIHDYNGGGRVRFVLPAGHELAVFVGGGEQAFSFRSQVAGQRDQLNIPDTIYHYVRAGIDARFELPSGMTLGLSGAYRFVFNQGGQIAQTAILNPNGSTATNPDGSVQGMGFFPFLTVAGVDFNGMLGYHITPSIEARFNVNLKRYFYNMHSSAKKCDTGCDFLNNGAQVNDVAGGAVDQYVGFTIGAAYIFGGVPPGASPAADEQPAEAAPAPSSTGPSTKKKKKKASDDEDDSGEDGSDKDDQGGSNGTPQ